MTSGLMNRGTDRAREVEVMAMPGASDEIFVIQGEDLSPLPARPFRAGLFGRNLEDALQTLLEKHPNVLPGRQMDPEGDDPPRFVLLCREMPSGGGSLDHLLVDQRAMLTLVETKLIQNSDARRAVIGQILEYAANAADSWGNGQARAKAIEFWSKRERNIDEIICDKLGQEDVEAFWNKVEEELQEGRIRLIIAADELRVEVRRVIEYLNTEMKRVKIFGLELRCYGKESDRLVLVPTLFGSTQAIKGPSDTTLWTVERLRSAYDNLPNRDMGERLRRVLGWAVEQHCFLEARAKYPVFGLRGRSGVRIVTFSPEWIFCYLNEKNFPEGAEERNRLVEELKILGMYERSFDPKDIPMGKNVARKLTDLKDDELKTLLEIFSRFCGMPERG